MEHDKKANALAQWHRILDDRMSWTNPAFTYGHLKAMASDMELIGLIDPLERVDLSELAGSAFSYFTEDGNREWRHQASEYTAYSESGVVVGSLLHSRYVQHSAGQCPYMQDHFAFLKEGNELILRTYKVYGRLEGRHIITETGETLTLVERSRQINGVHHLRLDDPDQYRYLIDAGTLALERGDFDGYVEIWERHNYSIFIQCPRCFDRFNLREDCNECAGRGFIEDPHCPNKLPKLLARKVAETKMLADRSL